MKILVLKNPARPLATKDQRAFDKLLRGHIVTTQILPKHRRPVRVNFDVQLIVVVGGDGSVLGAAHLARGRGIPILGFNTGHVGFLAGLTLANFRTELPHILAGRSRIEDRVALRVELPNGKNGWALGGKLENNLSVHDADRSDAESLYNVLGNNVIPMFYSRDRHGIPRKWIERMRNAMRSIIPVYNTHRMVTEYAKKYYFLKQ